MGFTVYYTSVAPVAPEMRSKIEEAAEALNERHSWLRCEPVSFFSEDDDGRWIGGSKPVSGEISDDDRAFAEASGLPDGTLGTVLEILCKLSSQFRVGWEISHDYSDCPIGTIIDGSPNEELTKAINELSEMGDE